MISAGAGRARGRGRVVSLALLFMSIAAIGSAEPVTVLQQTGDPSNRVDLVVLGDGYTAADLGKYASDVTTFLTAMLAQQPWTEYRNLLNIYRVDVTSTDSGASHPENNVTKNTAFSAAYNCTGIQRLICVNITAVNTVLGRSVTAAQRDLVVIIVNDSVYGGSGGAVAVASTNSQSVEIALHEIGHTLGLLADEYTDQPPNCDLNLEPSAANATLQTQRSAIKWNAWIDPSTAIPTTTTAVGVPGLYLGAQYCPTGKYRPTYDSKMRTLNVPYYQINTEQLIRRYYNFSAPLDGASPSGTSVTVPAGGSTTFQVSVPALATHSPSVTWFFDGASVATGPTLVAPASAIPAGSHTLTASIQDTTAMVRNDPSGVLRASRSWTISSGGGGAISAPGAPSSLTATSTGSSVTLAWSPPTSGSAPSVYIIEAGSAPGLADLANFSTGNALTTFGASGVGAGRYYVRVRSSNAAGTSASSNEAILVVGGVCTGPPASPTLSTSVSGSTVTLSWTAPAGATSFVLEAGSASGLSNLANTNVGGTPGYIATGVGAGTYYVRVRALNSCGTGSPSNETIVTVS
jgi:IgA peptidase M64